VIDASATDVAARVRELTGGKGADIVFNTVGDPYFRRRTNRWRCAGARS
jgi:NADPH2:quinone reductase